MISEEHSDSRVLSFFSSLEKNPRIKQMNVFLLISLGFQNSGANLVGNAQFVSEHIRKGSFEFGGKVYPITKDELSAFEPERFEAEAFQLMNIMHKEAGINEPKILTRLDYDRKTILPAALYKRVKSMALKELEKDTEVNYGETTQSN